MADKPESSGQEPNLELPSLLAFGRKKKRRKDEAAQERPAGAEPGSESVTTAHSEDTPLAADPAAGAATEPATEPATGPGAERGGGLAPSTEKAKRLPPVPPPTMRTDAPAQQIPVPPPPLPPPDEPGEVEKPPEVEPWKHEVGEAGGADAERAQITEPAVGGPDTSARNQHEPVPQTPPEQGTTLPLGDVETREAEPVTAAGEADDTRADVRVDEPFNWPVEEPLGDSDAGHPAQGASLALPVLNPRIAAILCGAVVGLVGVVLSYFASRGCETVRGVGSCGGMGLLALLVILAIEVVLGAILLKALHLSDPTSTSFLGVGLMAVVVVLFLLGSLESTWMMLVIPVVSALTFLLSWWVTTKFVEGPDSSQHR